MGLCDVLLLLATTRTTSTSEPVHQITYNHGQLSEVQSKASIDLFERLVARFDTHLLLYVKFLLVVVYPVVFVD